MEKALVNVVCHALGISTSRTEKDSNFIDEVKDILLFEDTFYYRASEA